MPRTITRLLIALLLTTHIVVASAQTRAWLDRDRIALGETTTLNIETDQPLAGAPDYSALMNDFQISNNVNSRQFEMVNGVSHSRVLFAIALQPRREGLIALPQLLVGNVRVQPPSLIVKIGRASCRERV